MVRISENLGKKPLARPHAKALGAPAPGPILTWVTERHRVWVGAGVFLAG